MTQKTLAAHFGITEQAVSGWESGESAPEPEKYPQLRQVLRLNYAWMLEGVGDPPEPDAPEVALDDMYAAAPHKVRSSVAKAIGGVRKRNTG